MKTFLLKLPEATFRILYSFLAFFIILSLAYLLGGYFYLVRGVAGTDTLHAFTMLSWIDKYFPTVPFWFPLAGGGISITHSYPMFSLYIVAFLKRILHLELLQALRIVGFSGIVSMAIGIYVFVSLRFKNQTAALFTSIFYLISPLAWTWLVDWGFYAEAVSHAFVMPAIIFWDLFFNIYLEKFSLKARIYLVATVIFSSLAFLAHFGSGMGLIALYFFYVIGYVVKKKERRKVLLRGAAAVFAVGTLMVILTFFVSFPYYRYTNIVSFAGLQGGPSYENLKISQLQADAVLGFRSYIKSDFLYAARSISFPKAVSILAGLGILLSFVDPRLLSYALFSIFALTASISAKFNFWMLNNVPLSLGTIFTWRYMSVALRAILPILASMGVVYLVSLPFFWVKNKYLVFIKKIVVALTVIVIATFALYKLGKEPSPSENVYNFGAVGINTLNIWGDPSKKNLCSEIYQAVKNKESLDTLPLKFPGYQTWCYSSVKDYFNPMIISEWCQSSEGRVDQFQKICNPGSITKPEVQKYWLDCINNPKSYEFCNGRFLSVEEQLKPESWPKPNIAGEPTPIFSQGFYETLGRIAGDNPSARVDFAPNASGISMIAPYYNLNRNLSQIHTYSTTSILNLRFQGYQSIAFYIDDTEFGDDATLINNLTNWFGINYAFTSGQKNTQRFKSGDWEVFQGDWDSGVLKYKKENKIAEFGNKPAVLVVARTDTDAYDQVFRVGARGVIPYEKAYIVWGKQKLDDYTLSELKSYSAVLLYGYTYDNFKNADDLLYKYVDEGGNLFIDTGWQYTVPDWQTEKNSKSLRVIPFEKLTWSDLGKTSDFRIEDENLYGKAKAENFAPLIYGDESWWVSTGGKSTLKPGVKTILSVKDSPLVTLTDIGKGKVVWSGMNIFSHANQGNHYYPEEINFLAGLFDYLITSGKVENYPISFARTNPDKSEFTFQEDSDGGFLLFKEAYYPDFSARLIDSDGKSKALTTNRAGPDFILINIPKVTRGDKMVYEYKKPFSEKASLALSILGIFLLVGIVLDGLLRKNSLMERISIRIQHVLAGTSKYVSFWWEKDDEK